MLLQNCTILPMDLIGLLNDIMISAENSDFTSFVKSVYFDLKRKTQVIRFTEYLNLAEAEYRTLYHAGKCLASKNDPASGFFVAHDEEPNYQSSTAIEVELERRGDRGGYG